MRPLAPRRLPLRRAFTLIELLTVIAIIGILAAIIIPVVGKVRTSARFAQDASNLRQIGMAALSYAGENRNMFPAAGIYFGGAEVSWDVALAPWLSTATTNSPSKRTSVIQSPLDPNIERSGRSYSWNRNRQGGVTLGAGGLTYGDPLTTPGITFRVSDFPEPSRTILVTARPDANQIAANFSYAGIDTPKQQLDADLANGSRYNGSFNYVMADASVRRLRAEETIGTGTIEAPRGYWTRAAGD